MASVKAPSQEAPRDRILSDDEAKLVWAAACERGYPAGCVVILGQRREYWRCANGEGLPMLRRHAPPGFVRADLGEPPQNCHLWTLNLAILASRH
jgi:hypothetical protein